MANNPSFNSFGGTRETRVWERLVMFENERIPVRLCCNDPDNGSFCGLLWAFEIGANMEFECKFGDWTPRLRYVVNAEPGTALIRAIALAGKHFPVLTYKPHCGNWCWDEFTMRGATVLELLNWSRLRNWYEIHAGEQRLFNWWKAGQQWTDQDLRLIGKVF